MTQRLTRRRMLQYGLGAAGAAVVPDLAQALWPGGGSSIALADTETQHELRQPHVLRSHHGRLKLKLICVPGVVHMGAPKPVRTYTYNGVVPGYTWELKAGDELLVDLRNHLPKLPHQPPMTMDRPHEWTTTNLHTHGLHVSPSGNADNIFLQIPPGHRQHYRIHDPRGPPGRASTGITRTITAPSPSRFAPGWPGLIIVRGDLDRVHECARPRRR